MGSSNNIIIILAIMCCVFSLLLPVSHAIDDDDPDSLDSFIRDFASNNTSRRRTGTLYEVVLPANLSGIEASIVVLKSGSLWMRGANFSLFAIPPRVLPWPFVKRLEIVYENLGNLSSSYFNLGPNHTFISPVIGLIAFDADRRNGSHGKIELNVIKDPITLHFPNISLPHYDKNATAVKCVAFQSNGTVEFSNVSPNTTCRVRGVGHFSLVVPTPTPPEEEKEKKKEKKSTAAWKWWVIIGSVVVGILGLVLLIGITYKAVKGRRLGKMERQSEKSESLDCVWVGSSKMPCATSIRTQPALENAYVP